MESYILINNSLITNKKISFGSFRLLTLLAHLSVGNTKKCFIKQEYLANKMKVSVRTIQRQIEELERNNLLTKKRRGSVPCEYTILADIKKRNTTIKNVLEGGIR